jgi:hypothetical protein
LLLVCLPLIIFIQAVEIPSPSTLKQDTSREAAINVQFDSYEACAPDRARHKRREDLITRSHGHLRAAFRAIHPSRPAAQQSILRYAHEVLKVLLVGLY